MDLIFPSSDSMLQQLAEIMEQGRGISPLFRLILVALVVASFRKKRVLSDYLAGYAALALVGAGVIAVALETKSKPNILNFAVLFSLGLLWGREALTLPLRARPGTVRIVLAAAFGLFALFYPYTHGGPADAVFFAPLGTFPSPSVALALALIVLTGRAYTLYAVIPTWIVGTLYGLLGTLYGLLGVFYLGVAADWVLLAAVPVSISSYLISREAEDRPKGRRFKRKR